MLAMLEHVIQIYNYNIVLVHPFAEQVAYKSFSYHGHHIFVDTMILSNVGMTEQ